MGLICLLDYLHRAQLLLLLPLVLEMNLVPQDNLELDLSLGPKRQPQLEMMKGRPPPLVCTVPSQLHTIEERQREKAPKPA
jgi:hypothetical protein